MTTAASVKASPVSAAIAPYRTRLAEDSKDFTLALLALAKSNARGSAGFNEPSPQDGVVLHALGKWRRDAQHALRRVRAVGPGSPGRKLAESWLKAMIAALDLQRQALSLVDPGLAAEAATSARKSIAEYQKLQARLERVIG